MLWDMGYCDLPNHLRCLTVENNRLSVEVSGFVNTLLEWSKNYARQSADRLDFSQYKMDRFAIELLKEIPSSVMAKIDRIVFDRLEV